MEKSAEMLRRAAMEGSMQTVGDEAKDLAQQQRKLADSAHASDTPESSRQQTAAQLADRTNRLASDMKKLGQRLDDAKAATGAAKTDEARQHAQSAEEKLREAAARAGATKASARAPSQPKNPSHVANGRRTKDDPH